MWIPGLGKEKLANQHSIISMEAIRTVRKGPRLALGWPCLPAQSLALQLLSYNHNQNLSYSSITLVLGPTPLLAFTALSHVSQAFSLKWNVGTVFLSWASSVYLQGFLSLHGQMSSTLLIYIFYIFKSVSIYLSIYTPIHPSITHL